ncbi:NADP-binding protein [Dacryopinax primogenitus]|uniref:NADP-binding protein n=1 Tax=Dacryopinax primogenitus (strain DJM 731) TaxID=1858805 RepID=M5FTX9_DACPD|nr:NADP-binding protein [Dacryopinax primogenitus]EJT96666.1 NADP-binding protein [Dacryopinax primogenitus]
MFSALSSDSLIVVTGITGYIASHVGLAALRAGHRVRGTVRSLQKAEALRAAYVKEGVDVSPARLEFVLVDDLVSEVQLAGAFADADAVAHVALPEFAGGVDFVPKTVESVLVPLRVAAKEKSIKRFVITSSSAAVVSLPDIPDQVLGETDWNENAIEAYKAMTREELVAQKDWWSQYRAAKALAEQAAWRFPHFQLSSVLPVVTWGPVLHGKPSLTPGWIADLLKGDTAVLSYRPQWYVDVRDAGRLHLLALTQPNLAGRRIFAAAGPISMNNVLDALTGAFPSSDLPGNVSGDLAEESRWKIDSELGRKVLGGKWISLEDCVVDTARSIGY